jgi:hypothetical protein
MKRPTTFLAFLFGAITAACGGAESNLPPPPPPPSPPPSLGATVVDASVAAEPTAAPAPATPPSLTAGAASPDPAAPLPAVKITAPSKDLVIAKDKAADFAVKLDVKGWATATGSSHVHLILDNRPYKPIYDTKLPVKLSELIGTASAAEALGEGQHVLVAFPSRANHESVKTAGALAIQEFYVGKKAPDAVDIKKPMLIYSRPKGDYKGDSANHVLVDFYVANVTLAAAKERVRVAVSGPGADKPLTSEVTKWGAPLYLDNLMNGTYTIKTDLLGPDGQPMPGPWNATTREIKIDHDAPTEPAHAGHGAPPAVDAGAPKK